MWQNCALPGVYIEREIIVIKKSDLLRLLICVVVFSYAAPAWAAESEVCIKEVCLKEIVINADVPYLLAELPENAGEIRLNFTVEVENTVMPIDPQTGFEVEWNSVQPGERVMVSYSRQPQGAQLHYLLLNLGDEPPKGLFVIEEMAGFAYNRMLVDNGRLWLRRSDGDFQFPDNFDMVYLGVGRRILVWYDEEKDGQAICTILRAFFSQPEVQEHRQAKAWEDMYYNEGKTRHLWANGAELPNVVRYVHGEPYLPLRQTAEALGYDVEWDAAVQAAYLTDERVQARIVPYKAAYLAIDGRSSEFYGLPRIYDGCLCVPAMLFEVLGAEMTVSNETMILNL